MNQLEQVRESSKAHLGKVLFTSCDSHPIPATKLLVSRHCSDRGACGFVLNANEETTRFLGLGKCSPPYRQSPDFDLKANSVAACVIG